MPKESGYQGWANRSTWAVALWVDNDEGLYRERLRLVKQSTTLSDDDTDCAEALKEWLEEMAPDLGATLWSDLLSYAINEVDWLELARHWIEEANE